MTQKLDALVERLRRVSHGLHIATDIPSLRPLAVDLMVEAADELERLRADGEIPREPTARMIIAGTMAIADAMEHEKPITRACWYAMHDSARAKEQL
jgi:hypothetical protein